MVRSFMATVLIATCAAAGCARPPRGEVEGIVTLDGVPVPEAVVYFIPDLSAGSNGPTSWGSTDARGSYSLADMRTGEQGAFVGAHRVVCKMPELAKGPRLPGRYGHPETTPLRFEVREGKQTIDLALTARP